MRFLDTFRFLPGRLEKMLKNSSKDKFRETSKYYRNSKLDLIKQKDIYLCDYMNSIE